MGLLCIGLCLGGGGCFRFYFWGFVGFIVRVGISGVNDSFKERIYLVDWATHCGC